MLLIVFVPVTAFILTYGLNVNLAEGLRLSLFNIVSALSTTGYSTMPTWDYRRQLLGNPDHNDADWWRNWFYSRRIKN